MQIRHPAPHATRFGRRRRRPDGRRPRRLRLPALVVALLDGALLGGALLGGLVPAAQGEECGDPPYQVIGTLEDSHVWDVPAGAARVYYLAPDGRQPAASVLTNALGNEQVLFYDIYPPIGLRRQATILYIHGGGYTVGGASYGEIVRNITQLRELGFWTVSLEYRRGWFNGGACGVFRPVLPEEVPIAELAFKLALEDVLAGWDHVHANAGAEYNYPPRYVLIGQSAGGSLASRAALIERPAEREILGVIAGYGTHRADEEILDPPEHAFPVVIQGGMFDETSPLYTRNLFHDPLMPNAKGLRDLYAELRASGYPSRLLLSAHTGHGFGVYQPLEDGPILHYPESLDYFEEVYYGGGSPDHVEYRFKCPDPQNPDIRPGDVIDTLTTPGFTYEPYESAFQADGATPLSVRALYGLVPCG